MSASPNPAVVLPREPPAEPAYWRRFDRASALEAHTPIPRLDRYRFHSRLLPEPESRTVFVYLPPQYEREPNRRFPVFYLQDGQNLFDPRTSYIAGHTWCAHTTADRLTTAGEIAPVILVGVANTGLRRMAEYTPSRDFKLGGGEGPTYGRMLIDELKPLVDRTYRTLAGPRDTAVGGSSLGGLISLYLGFEQPDVFGNIAVLSPSLWWDQRSILALVARDVPIPALRPQLRIWLDIGTAEGTRHVRDTELLERRLIQQGWTPGVDLELMKAEGGFHSEDAWAARFDRVLAFLFPAR